MRITFHTISTDEPTNERDRLPRSLDLVPVRRRALNAPRSLVARVKQAADRILRRRPADFVAGVVPGERLHVRRRRVLRGALAALGEQFGLPVMRVVQEAEALDLGDHPLDVRGDLAGAEVV